MAHHNNRGRRLAAVISTSALAFAGTALLLTPTASAAGDRDGDGMPNRWELNNGLNPNVANAKGDRDHDGLRNLAEFRKGADPVDEDSDNDGMDDGDEVNDGLRSTAVSDRDTDNDGLRDGDEDADHDGLDNEDEDDARESCARDDDDVDGDNISDEDENELGFRVGDSDSDNDGVEDGVEDGDHDGVTNEDEDDEVSDHCDGDYDGDGEDDEDEGDLMGTIAGFDSATGILTVDTLTSGQMTFVVGVDTEIEFDESDVAATTADLIAGAQVSEIEVDDETGTLEKVQLV